MILNFAAFCILMESVKDMNLSKKLAEIYLNYIGSIPIIQLRDLELYKTREQHKKEIEVAQKHLDQFQELTNTLREKGLID